MSFFEMRQPGGDVVASGTIHAAREGHFYTTVPITWRRHGDRILMDQPAHEPSDPVPPECVQAYVADNPLIEMADESVTITIYCDPQTSDEVRSLIVEAGYPLAWATLAQEERWRAGEAMD